MMNPRMDSPFSAAPTQDLLGILVQSAQLTPEQAQAVRDQALANGQTPEAALEAQGIVNEIELVRAKATLANLPFLSIANTGSSPEAIGLIPESVARRYRALPIAVNKATLELSLAMVNPGDVMAIDFLQKKTGYRILPSYVVPSELDRALTERYSQTLSSEVKEAVRETKDAAAGTSLENLALLSREVGKEAPITKIVETILAYAMKSRASDIHLEPLVDRTRVRYRIDGVLGEKLILPRSVHDAVVSRIKIMSELKLDERRLPQDGRFAFSAEGQDVDLRVSTLPTVHGEKVVMRLLKKTGGVPSLTELGLRGQALQHVERAMRLPQGVILVTGPTGSGKTTTLYSILNVINTPKVNIMTLEDPVEYQVQGVNQVQVNPAAGLTFATGLRSFLRQDPNIIMVGEIRDQETAELAVQAALTGHLMFSTLHTNSAAAAMPRLLDMGIEPFLIASTLTLTVGQRVVRVINPNYKESYVPESTVVADFRAVLGPLYDSWCQQHQVDPEKPTLYRPNEQRPAEEPAYQGRVGIYEVMPMSDTLARLIMEHKTDREIQAEAIKGGMLLMKQDGYLKVLEGLTTLEEVLRVAETSQEGPSEATAEAKAPPPIQIPIEGEVPAAPTQ
jgi:type IV pilus assembly protein PilB